MAPELPPTYDDSGLNLADPHDTRGLKTAYISTLQMMAIARYVRVKKGPSIDLGCGYGRMTSNLASLGHTPIGVDPSRRILNHAMMANPNLLFCNAKLPDLPFKNESISTVFLLNVIRPLHLLELKEACSGVQRVIATKGQLVIIDNVRQNHEQYVEESWYENFFYREGLQLKRRIAIRASRWPLIFLIRFGLIPKNYFPAVATWELSRMTKKAKAPRYSYHNVLWIFEKE